MINFEKSAGLVPVIIQHAGTLQVLMLGYMNEEALEKTKAKGKSPFTAAASNGYGPRARAQATTLSLRRY